MAEHLCTIHNCKFYKNEKDGREWYSHKIKGEDGYCNEQASSPEASQATKKPTTSPDDTMTKEEWADKARVEQDCMDRRTAIIQAPALVESKNKYPSDTLSNTAYNWAVSKLSNWSSMGAISEEPVEEGAITPEQIERIKEAAKKYTDDMAAYLKMMKGAYKQTNYKKLNAFQAEDLIKRLDKGEGLGKETPREDVPF